MKAVHAALRQMLGPDVGVGVTDPRDGTGGLWPEEAQAIARAIPKRRAEFTAGRRAAREAITALSLSPTAIVQGPDRAPVWPAGLCGSIAHCDTCCIAAVARPSNHPTLGIDVEPATPLQPDLIDIVCNPSERDWLATQPNLGLAAKTIFSAKEAVYKAQYPLTGAIIGFDAVTLVIEGQSFIVKPNPKFPKIKGTILIESGLILTTAHV